MQIKLSMLLVALLTLLAPTIARAQVDEEEIIAESGQVLREVMAIPGKNIPQALLADAQGVVIVPGMIKGGFVVGIKHGQGIAISRDEKGAWRAPVFVSVTGGSIGWQIGLQATDVVLVFRTKTSVAGMMKGKFTIGADASVAAGPVGRDMSASTDSQLKAEILSYSRSRGLFAGLAIDGAAIQPEQRSTSAYYGQTPANPTGRTPASAVQLLQLLTAYSTPKTAQPVSAIHDDRETLRRQLLASHAKLMSVLDPAWKQYLALPAEFAANAPPTLDSLKKVQDRFQALASNPQYRGLVERQDYQETWTLLNRYTLLQEAGAAQVLQLPPPPK